MATEIHEGAVVKVLVCQDTDSEIVTVNQQPLLTRSFHWSSTYRERETPSQSGWRARDGDGVCLGKDWEGYWEDGMRLAEITNIPDLVIGQRPYMWSCDSSCRGTSSNTGPSTALILILFNVLPFIFCSLFFSFLFHISEYISHWLYHPLYFSFSGSSLFRIHFLDSPFTSHLHLPFLTPFLVYVWLSVCSFLKSAVSVLL